VGTNPAAEAVSPDELFADPGVPGRLRSESDWLPWGHGWARGLMWIFS
jgi:hypothetical protein